jgi:voltage-gated potassium channel
MTPQRPRLRTVRARLYRALDDDFAADGIAYLIRWILIVLIVGNLAASVAESVPSIREQHSRTLFAFELLSFVAFLLEYAARVWAAPERHAASGTRGARFAFITSPQGVVDAIVLATFVLPLFFDLDLRIVLVLRMLRVLKLARYSSGMRSLMEALIDERRALWGCLMILACATLVAATAMYVAEGRVQPDKLGTIPEAAWWAIVTLGTIGYGDVIPVTPAGRLVASITIVAGLVMIALPVGIVATAFAEVIHRREFIVTWSMVSRVPLFADLKASDIADIMQLLRAERFDRGDIVARRGEAAHSMYFVASGEVGIEVGANDIRDPIRLGPGQFFGEIAALKRTRRSATVRALSRVNLLALDVTDLHALMLREPAIEEKVLAVARERAGGNLNNLDGDLIVAELQDSDRPMV